MNIILLIPLNETRNEIHKIFGDKIGSKIVTRELLSLPGIISLSCIRYKYIIVNPFLRVCNPRALARGLSPV